jgi:hypothetical protein
MCDADPANVFLGGKVDTVLTRLIQRRDARFFAMPGPKQSTIP